MRLFKKKPAANATLAELESYYGVKRGGGGRSLFASAALALGAVLVAAVLAFGIFYGGRWVWRKNQAYTNAINGSSQTAKKPPAATPTPTKVAVTTVTPTPTHTPTPTPKPTATPTPTPTPKPTTAPTPKPTAAFAPALTPSPTPTPTPASGLPNTGPGSLLTIFAGVTILSAIIYEIRLRFASDLL